MQVDGNLIYLRPIQKEDLPYFVEWLSDMEVNHFLLGRSYTWEEELFWFNTVTSDPNERIFSVFLKSSDEIIGNCGIHFAQKREDVYHGKTFIGLMIGKKNEWGKGYGTETVKTLLNYLKKETDLKEVYLTVFCENKSAIKCYEKCGFEILEKRKAPERTTMNEYVMKVIL